MIRTDHTDASIVECLTQGITIMQRLNGWIALDTCTQGRIVTIIEIEM